MALGSYQGSSSHGVLVGKHYISWKQMILQSLCFAILTVSGCVSFQRGKLEMLVGKSGKTFQSISEALRYTRPGDTIRVVDSATYTREDIIISTDNIAIDLGLCTLKNSRVLIQDASGVTVCNGRILASQSHFGVETTRATRCAIRNIKIEQNERVGVFMQQSSDNVVEDCVISNNKEGGIFLSRNCTNNRIMRNAVEDCFGGIGAYDNCSGNLISGNVVVRSKHEHGINIGWGSDHNQILDNRLIGNEGPGITLHDNVVGNILINNECSGNHTSGILLLNGVQDSQIVSNKVFDNWEDGISIQTDIDGNIITNNDEWNNGLGDKREAGTQNDADTGRDATSRWSVRGEKISFGTYRGYLSDADIQDWFKIEARVGTRVHIRLVSPAGADFDLVVLDENRTIWIPSNKFDSEEEEVYATFPEDSLLYVRLFQWDGEGEYSLRIEQE